MDFPALHPPRTVGRLLYQPLATYPVAVAVQLPQAPQLDLGQLCALLLGEIRLWNDPKLAQAGGVRLPALPVLVISRSDPNAASFAVSQTCSTESRNWRERIGVRSRWQAGASKLVSGLEAQRAALALPGSLTVMLPSELPPGAQSARLRAVGGEYFGFERARFGFAVPRGLREPWQGAVQLPSDPYAPLPAANAPDAYPLRGLLWGVALEQQKYRGRGRARAEALRDLLRALRSGGVPEGLAPLPNLPLPGTFFYGAKPLP
ncbi:phosphate transport system substrate-binding protein [Deinobacterium chartae]|uniref:Phosphate transport system substrate-binding protein n=1 Tax=Deinobacterium chartae TaxID=521158 RepID=A0A841I190_9DEIO|nr:phosphate transport system substrate-binding protein [Deinobacterium chartae]